MTGVTPLPADIDDTRNALVLFQTKDENFRLRSHPQAEIVAAGSDRGRFADGDNGPRS